MSRVVVVRGDALNPYEMQAFAALDSRFDVLAVGRRRPGHETHDLGVPHRLLPSPGQFRLAPRILSRIRSERLAALNPHHLIGLERLTRGAAIVHSAETALPITHQSIKAARRVGARLVLTCWENIPFRSDEDARTRERKAEALGGADRFIAVTPRAARALRLEGVDEDRIDVIPAAVDCRRFAPEGRRAPLLKELGAGTDEMLLLYVGRMIQEKGVTELVQAFAAIDGPRARLVMIGAGDQEGRVMHAARQLGVGERVSVRPHVTYRDLPLLLRAADVVVIPSLSAPYWQEQFGMILVEALATGAPVVTTSSGSIPEVVGDAALVVRDYDVQALSDALKRVCRDPALRRRLSEMARARALAKFDTSVVAKQLAATYDQVLEQPAAAG